MTSRSPGENTDDLQNTMIHHIVHSSLPPAEKTFDRVFEEIATVTGAGYETTANALRLIIYHVFTDDEILRRLRTEIASTSPSPPGKQPIPLTTLEHMPYLKAVLTEGLRLSPGIGTRAGRVTDKDIFYGDWRIPAGTPVGMTTLLMHTDEKMYPDPMRFNPDRWVDKKTKPGTDKPLFAPFSRGTRMCLGMQ